MTMHRWAVVTDGLCLWNSDVVLNVGQVSSLGTRPGYVRTGQQIAKTKNAAVNGHCELCWLVHKPMVLSLVLQ